VTLLQVGPILSGLTVAEVEFVLIGGLAAIAHGSARMTYDADVCYHRTPENIERLCHAVAGWSPRLRGAPEGLPFHFDPATVKSGLNFTLSTDLGSLDLLGEVSGLGFYPDVLRAAESHPAYGVELMVLSIDGLLRAKRAAGRRKDLEAIVELEALQELRRRGGG
jgi:hypothetical protein